MDSQIQNVIDNGYEVEIKKYLSEGWQIYRQAPGLFAGYTLIYVAIIALSFVPLLGNVISIFFTPVFIAGYYCVALKIMRGESPSFGDFWRSFDHYGSLIAGNLVGGILVLLGFICLILPGIYLAIGFTFMAIIIVDRGMPYSEALTASRKIIHKKWFSIFVYFIFCVVIGILGLVTIIGIFIVMPFLMCSLTVAYKNIIGDNVDGLAAKADVFD